MDSLDYLVWCRILNDLPNLKLLRIAYSNLLIKNITLRNYLVRGRIFWRRASQGKQWCLFLWDLEVFTSNTLAALSYRRCCWLFLFSKRNRRQRD